MDRTKIGVKRPVKGKGHPPPGEFIALGSKPEAKSAAPPVPVRKPVTSVSAPIKRESAPSTSVSVAKKPKLSSQTFTPLGRHDLERLERRGSPTAQTYLYEEIAREVEASEFLDTILDAVEREDEERAEALLCGAVRYLKINRHRPEPSMSLSLLFLSKHQPHIFNSEVIIEALCSLLKRDVSLSFKTKGNPVVSVLACNILLGAFQEEENWPDNFIKVYMDDALGERLWVDRSDCKAFVENIQTAFNTKMPKISAIAADLASEKASAHSGGGSPMVKDEDEDSMHESDISFKDNDEDISALVFPRYSYQPVGVETYVLDILREQLSRRQSMDGGSRNLLRVMTATCGYTEIRTMAAQRLEMWLQNPKLTRPAQDLLMSLCMNCDQHSQVDIDVMAQLCKIRLKTKPLINHYLLSIRELLGQHPENIRTLIKNNVHNELTNSRNPNNMALLSVSFNLAPEQSAKLLAEIFQDLLTNRDEHLRAVRILLREINRAVKQDMNYAEFAVGLMKERNETKFKDMDPTLKERLFMSITDLITLITLLSVTPSVKESASALARGDNKDLEVLHQFQRQVALIQRDSVSWLHTVAPKMFDIKQNEYVHCLRKLLFMELPDHYTKIDNWPPENDRNLMLRLVGDVPVLEDTLLRTLIMGLMREIPVNATDAIELVDTLIKRAAMQHSDDLQVLVVEKVDLIDLLFNLCTYRHPENIVLPKGYKPPGLAITNLYWKAWVIMLIISAFNPARFGFTASENYPMLKCLMEMVMTRNFVFPPPTMSTDEKTIEDIRNRERQLAELEKQQILEFEGHLAAATSRKQITDTNSLLLTQLTTMDPSGPPRRPPGQLLEQLEALNKSLGIGQLLCRSRDPDFLLDIIHRQGTSQSMPWLAELVESNEGSLDVLPVQCLCEFLLHDSPLPGEIDDDDDKGEKSKKKQKLRKQQQLLGRLQKLLHSSTSDARTICEVLNYFLKRLSSQSRSNRILAVKGLSMVLSHSQIDTPDDAMETEENQAVVAIPTHKWLLEHLPALPQFPAVKPQTCASLRQACQVETDASAVSAYIVFLSQHTADLMLQELDELALDLAQLIVERATLINHLLPQEGVTVQKKRADYVLGSMINLFYGYLLKAQEPDKEAYSWSNTQDQILLQWVSGKSATINVLVVHAMIILLTYGKPIGESMYHEMLSAWFPADNPPPSAYLVDTSEEALLLPDWLKLRMIRSSSQVLVDAALVDLEPAQLLLFVQSFGIPVASMSKLLKCLDEAVALDSYAMEQVVVDKGYMAQLVQVQHMRGAVGGERFYSLLTDGITVIPTSDGEVDEVEMKPSPRKRAASQITRTPELPDSQPTGLITSLLQQIFGIGAYATGLSQTDRNGVYRSLMKGLVKVETCKAVVISLTEMLLSQDRIPLVTAMKMSIHFSCPILRLLIAKQDVLGGGLLQLMSLLAQSLEGSRSALSNVVSGYLVAKARTTEAGQVTGELTNIRRQVQHEEEVFNIVASAQTARSESFVSQVMTDTVEQNNIQQRTASVCSKLLTRPHSLLQSTAGMLVDWLELLDPEIISQVPDLQQQLLFARQSLEGSTDSPGGSTMASCQPYLLALLTHQCSWESLHKCLHILFNKTASDGFSATAALDFLHACVYIPKIWQGREKVIPKNAGLEDILQLSSDQIISMVSYIAAEACDSKGHVTPHVTISQRLPLLLRCCNKQRHLLDTVVSYLYQQMRSDSSVHSVWQTLLLELYLQTPDVVGISAENALISDSSDAQAGISALDALTHRIISGLGGASIGKASENRMYDSNIACRTLAAQHPLLVLRQLPMISALLTSRAHFTFGELKHRNHLLLYTHVLGILELLQPYLFHKDYHVTLAATLKSFFELVKIHGFRNRSLGSVIIKLVKLLHNFMIQDAPHASQMLQDYIPVLNGLTRPYPDIPLLRALVAALTLPMQDTEVTQTSEVNQGSGPSQDNADPTQIPEVTPPTLHPPRPTSPWNLSQLAPYLNRIAKGNSTEDVLMVLKDLDETSKRKVDVLEHFLSDLRRLLLDSDDSCRHTAHSLLMRYIRHNPTSADELVPAFLQCLDSSSVDVVNSMLKNLAEFCLLAQEYAEELLQKAFKVGVFTKVETGSYITEAVQLLNMETMM